MLDVQVSCNYITYCGATFYRKDKALLRTQLYLTRLFCRLSTVTLLVQKLIMNVMRLLHILAINMFQYLDISFEPCYLQLSW